MAQFQDSASLRNFCIKKVKKESSRDQTVVEPKDDGDICIGHATGIFSIALLEDARQEGEAFLNSLS